MALSNITYTTVVLNASCLCVTSGFGILIYLFVFLIILTPLGKIAAEMNSPWKVSPSDLVFVSFGLNDCVTLICYIIAAVRATINNMILRNDMANAYAFVLTGSRICRRYHMLFLIVCRLIAMASPERQRSLLSKKKLIPAILFVWGASYAMAYPVWLPPAVYYPINYFAIRVRNADVRFYLFVEEIAATGLFVLCALPISPWVMYKHMKYRKPKDQLDTEGGIYAQTATAEMSRFVQEAKKSVGISVLIVIHLACGVSSWILARDDGGDEARKTDQWYMLRFFFGVYVWCLNSALSPTIYIICERVIQKMMVKYFEKNNQVGPDEYDPDAFLARHPHLHIDAMNANDVVVYPMLEFGGRPEESAASDISAMG